MIAVLLAFTGCAAPEPAQGTFVGNPTLSGRLAESQAHPVIDGLLVAPEVLLGDCDGVGDVALGSRSLAFTGPLSDEVLQIPTGDHCGVFFVVTEFIIRIDEGGPVPTTVIAQDFDLWVQTRFEAREGGEYEVRFGDPAWLEAVAAAAEPGENRVDADHPALYEAFFDGLGGSSVEAGDPGEPTLPDTVPGAVDADGYPISPLGTPSRFPGCGPGVNYDLAVPVPAAAMAAIGQPDEVGWCEANVRFADDPTPRSALQVDYADGSLFEVPYNGWTQSDCGAVHCGALYTSTGAPLELGCTALALCADEQAVVTGFTW